MKQQPHTNSRVMQGHAAGASPRNMRGEFGSGRSAVGVIIADFARALPGLALVLVLGIGSARAQSTAPVAPGVPVTPNGFLVSNALAQPEQIEIGGQSYFDGLEVKAGEAIEGDAVVYTGDVRVRAGGRINGGVVAYAGDVRIDAGAVVTGDLTAWAGDVVVDGRVEGNISVLSGDVRLGGSASVGGDVSVLAGDISRSDGASIQGDVVRGPGVGGAGAILQGLDRTQFRAPAASSAPSAPHGGERNNGGPWFFKTFLRIILVGLLTIALTLGAMLLYLLRPQTVERATDDLRNNTIRSLALGITVTGALWLLTFLLARAFCFAPLSIIPGIATFVLSAVGFTVVARWVGRRLAGGNGVDRRAVMEVAMGGLLVAAIFLFLAALIGGAWELWAFMLVLPAAPGVGAYVYPWFDKYRNRSARDLSSPGRLGAAPFGPKPPAPPAPPAMPAVPAPPAPPAAPSSMHPAAPVATVQLPEAPVSSAGQPVDRAAVNAPAAPAPQETVRLDLPEIPEAPLEVAGGLEIDDLVAAAEADAARAAELAAQTAAAEEQAAAAQVYGGDDLTQISGIGRSWERKLKAAGVMTYAQLAALPLELVATILGVPREEVIEDKILQQAANLTSAT